MQIQEEENRETFSSTILTALLVTLLAFSLASCATARVEPIPPAVVEPVPAPAPPPAVPAPEPAPVVEVPMVVEPVKPVAVEPAPVVVAPP